MSFLHHSFVFRKQHSQQYLKKTVLTYLTKTAKICLLMLIVMFYTCRYHPPEISIEIIISAAILLNLITDFGVLILFLISSPYLVSLNSSS